MAPSGTVGWRRRLATEPADIGDEDVQEQGGTDNGEARDELGQAVDAARRHEAPDPIVWERARPTTPTYPTSAAGSYA